MGNSCLHQYCMDKIILNACYSKISASSLCVQQTINHEGATRCPAVRHSFNITSPTEWNWPKIELTCSNSLKVQVIVKQNPMKQGGDQIKREIVGAFSTTKL